MDFAATKLHPETSKVLYLIRGVPGSGKSTLARILQEAYHTDDWYEADMYFEKGGEYKFNPKQIGEAHAWCQSNVSRAMGRKSQCIIVSNTSTRQWECDPYRELASKCGYTLIELICKNEFPNTHGVPEKTITRMLGGFEYDRLSEYATAEAIYG